MKEPLPIVTFFTRFDVDQISAKLDWYTSGDSQPPTGKHSGAVYFGHEDIVKFEVQGGGTLADMPNNPHPLVSFEIVDCCIITRPQIVECGPAAVTQYAPPSPFSGSLSACHQLALKFTKSSSVKNQYLQITEKWDSHLQIGKQNGRWEISLYLTVKITRKGLSEPAYRVFYFDPEGEVGTGLMF